MKKREEESPRFSPVRGLTRKRRAPLGIFLPKWEAAANNFSAGGEGRGLRGGRCGEFKQPGGGTGLATWDTTSPKGRG